MNTTKRTMKKIYTVIITEVFEYDGADVSTVSFTKFKDAVDYCIEEIGLGDDEDVRNSLEKDMFYYDECRAKYYIEEANLIG